MSELSLSAEKIYLWSDPSIRTRCDRPSITPYLCSEPGKRPAVLVIPGGGYGMVCETTEGSPIARKFNELGFHAFVLDYRTAPSRWPEPQQDAMRAVKIIRGRADEWQIDGEKVSVCGFSAGAHLAASLGTLCGDLDAGNGDGFDDISALPYAMILCYGVLSLAEWSHRGTCCNLLGSNDAVLAEKYSPASHVSAQTPPAFLMHTICDQVVNFRNSMEFVNAMAAVGRPCELMLNYWGMHGMLLGKNTLDVVKWPEQAVNFLKTLDRMAEDPEYIERYTNIYQGKML